MDTGIHLCFIAQHSKRKIILWRNVKVSDTYRYSFMLYSPNVIRNCMPFLFPWTGYHAILCWLVECTTIGIPFQQSNKCRLPHLVSLGFSHRHQRAPLLILKALFRINQSFTPFLCCSLLFKKKKLLKETWQPLFWFSRGILIVTFCLAEVLSDLQPQILNFLHT